MRRLGELDFPDRLAGRLPVPVSQMIAALVCTIIALGARAIIDMAFPGAGPFALIFPSVLAATLFARWQAGVLTMIVCSLYAWYFVLPVKGSFALSTYTDGPRVVVNIMSGFIIIALAEVFRKAVSRAAAERDREIAERELYLQEFDHRVKNNFASVIGILNLQQQRATGEEAREALEQARGRVNSIARAHGSLYRGENGHAEVNMRTYLASLCEALTDALFHDDGTTLKCIADPVPLPRDQAISIGLLVNELVTNAAKHAFGDRKDGRVTVKFTARDDAMRLVVEDDGVGMDAAPEREGSLGQRLMEGFAAQANGELEKESSNAGTRFVFTLQAA